MTTSTAPSPYSRTYSAFSTMPKATALARIIAGYTADHPPLEDPTKPKPPCIVIAIVGEYEHGVCAEMLGVAPGVPYVLEGIYDSLSPADAHEFKYTGPMAIVEGSNTAFIAHGFMHWLLTDPVHGLIRYTAGHKQQEQAVGHIIELFEATLAHSLAPEEIAETIWQLASIEADKASSDTPEAETKSLPDTALHAAFVASVMAHYMFGQLSGFTQALRFAVQHHLVSPLVLRDELLRRLASAPVPRVPMPRVRRNTTPRQPVRELAEA